MNNDKTLVKVTISIDAVLMVGKYLNYYQLAKKAVPEILRELASTARIDFDDSNADEWDKDFIPYGDNENEMPLYALVGKDGTACIDSAKMLQGFHQQAIINRRKL